MDTTQQEFLLQMVNKLAKESPCSRAKIVTIVVSKYAPETAMTLEEIGNLMQYSKERGRQIVNNVQQKLHNPKVYKLYKELEYAFNTIETEHSFIRQNTLRWDDFITVHPDNR